MSTQDNNYSLGRATRTATALVMAVVLLGGAAIGRPAMAAESATAGDASTSYLVWQVIGWTIASIILIRMIVLGRRSRKLKKELGYPKGQRVRLWTLEFLEPPLELAILGVLLVHELTTDWQHVAVAILAIVPGILLGRYRAGQMFVAALPEHKAVVVTRTRGEIYALVGIILLKTLENVGENVAFPNWLTLILTAGLIIILVDSTTRVATLHQRYKQSTSELLTDAELQHQ